eukprot:m.356391 g.356391  ORF g.356391 m.356391 type:complete len:244 (-) comp17532_c0_seq1:477-1208(-)
MSSSIVNLQARLDFLITRGKTIFRAADRQNNGWLSKTDMKKALHEDDALRVELRTSHGRKWADFWDELDLNGDGKIQIDELVDYITKTQVEAANELTTELQDRAGEIFRQADKDNSGSLTKSELKNLLHADYDIRDELRTTHGRGWKDFFQELDTDGDGTISLEELVEYIGKTRSAAIEKVVAFVEQKQDAADDVWEAAQSAGEGAADAAAVPDEEEATGPKCENCVRLEARIAELEAELATK